MTNIDTIEKGSTVNQVKRSIEIPSPRTGRFATLRGQRRAGGSGPSSVRSRLTSIGLGVVLCLVLLVPATASAHFIRPFLREIAGTPTGEKGAEVPFGSLGGIATDGEDNLWALNGSGSLDEFGPSGAYLQMLEPPSLNGAENIGIGSTGTMYVSSNHLIVEGSSRQVEVFNSTGILEKTLKPAADKKISPNSQGLAVDNSTDPLDPSAGDLYVSSGGIDSVVLTKFNAAGEEQDWEGFKGSTSCECSVSGSEIIFESVLGEGGAVAVDPSDGDIWVQIKKAVFEFSPGGDLIREVTGEEAPGLSEGHGFKGSYVRIGGLAVDPTNGDLLVSLSHIFGPGSDVHTEGAVDEFDSNGAFLGQTTEAAGLRLSGAYGLAVDSHGDLYVVNHPYGDESGLIGGGTDAVDEFEAGHFVPGLRPAAATQRTQSSAVLNGFVDPESELNPEKIGSERVGIIECHFEYVTEAAYEKSGFEDLSSGGEAPCEDPDAAGVPKSDAYTPVHAAVSEHIESGVTYRYRLSAKTGGLLGGVAHGASVAFVAAHAPRVSGAAASEITSNFARLSGDVAPLGASTSYQFQYLPEEEFERDGGSFAGAAVAPVTPAEIGAGGEVGDLVEGVGESIGGLAPSTTYRFRLVASNAAGVSEGEVGEGGGEVAHTFTTEPAVSPVLPDGRAYELLTPPDKEGAEDMFRAEAISDISDDVGVASGSGDQFLLATRAAFGSFPGSGGNLYLFARGPVAGHPEREEWGYTSLASSTLGLQNLGAGLGAIEPEGFSRVALTDRVGAPASEAGVALTSLLGPSGGPYTTLHADQRTHNINVGTNPGLALESTQTVGASRDLGVIVLQSTNPALAEGGLCEHDLCPEPIPQLYEWAGGELSRLDVTSEGEPVSSCGAALGGGNVGGAEEADDGAVSDDGLKVFFTAPVSFEEFRGLEGVKGCATKGGENPPELYLRVGEETVEVSAPEEGAPEHRAHHEAVFFGAAGDGSRVFFTSEGELTANDAGINDVELYEYDTETRKLTRVSAGDSGDAKGGVVPFDLIPNRLGKNLIQNVVVAGDGSRVYFVARGVLAPANAEGRAPVAGEENLYVYDTQTGRTAFIAAGAKSGEHEYLPETTSNGRYLVFQGMMLSEGASQLYRYDAETEGLVCVSCTAGDPSGAGVLVPSAMNDTAGGTFPAHAVAEDGSVFFNTAASLVPQDTNGVLDVYEWHEGAVSLISSGQDPLPSFFLGASPNGANVFFGTHARLVPADTSGGGNLYDARVCTASEPCIAAAPAREGLCEGDACSRPAAAPGDATPASATFSGPGNLTPMLPVTSRAKSCVKPKKLSHGKCVAAKPKRRKAKAKPRAKARGRRTSTKGAIRSDRKGERS
jgi:hypothetical protein